MDLQSEKVPESIYIVTEYCGENLPMYMARMGNRVSLEDAAKIVYNIARGLNVWLFTEFLLHCLKFGLII